MRSVDPRTLCAVTGLAFALLSGCGEPCPPGTDCEDPCPAGMDCEEPCPPGMDCEEPCTGSECEDPCSAALTCGECPLGCDWCAGECVTQPRGGVGGDWCEWGYALDEDSCNALNGAGIVRSVLPVDCRPDRNREDLLCDSDGTIPPGVVGDGPPFPAGGTRPGILGGAIDAASRTIYVTTTDNVRDRDGAEGSRGAIFAVDLDTGDRTLVSGAYDDPRVGLIEAGEGPRLSYLADLQLHPEGGLVVWDLYQGFIRVSDDGDRELILPADQRCMVAGTEFNYPSFVTEPQMAVGPDGTIYVPLGYLAPSAAMPDGNGEVRAIGAVDSTGCRTVSIASTDEALRLGEGPQDEVLYQLIAFDEGRLLAVTEFGAVHAVDPVTGDRTGISDVGRGLGSGGEDDVRPRAYGITRGPGSTLWMGGGETALGRAYGPVLLTIVDLETGDASARYNLAARAIGTMAPDAVLRHPDSDNLVIVLKGNAVVIGDLAAGNVNWLSF